MNEGEISNAEEYLLQLNNYTVDDLKQVYLQTLKKNALSDDPGAGVGLIDVRRYNQSVIDYEIHKYKDGSYLSMGVFIPIIN